VTEVIKFSEVENRVVEVRKQQVLIDTDVANLYGVETKRINEAVKNNSNKFPDGYLLELSQLEKNQLVENFDRFDKLKHSTAIPKAFTEKGLYMLATILKSPQAVETTLAIIETFAKVRELSHMIHQIQSLPEHSPKQKTLMERSGDLIGDLIIPDDELDVIGTETTYEMNLAIFKLKRTVKKGK
jgi:hypothetical protein